MKKSDLKTLIKPLVKECIHEVLLEEGLLSTIVTEVAQGMQGGLIVESRTPRSPPPSRGDERMQRINKETRRQMSSHRQGLMDAIGRDAYNGVDLFEDTQPIREHKTGRGQPDLGHPEDAGVDISALVGNAAQVWKAIK